MAVVLLREPPRPDSAELATALPVYGTAPQSLCDALNYLVGHRMRRFVSTTVECDVDSVWRRANNFPQAGTADQDVQILMRLSPDCSFVFVEVEYITTLPTEKSDPAPEITATLEETDGTEIDKITWSPLPPTPGLLGDPDDDNPGGRSITITPEPLWASTGWQVDADPPSGDETPRPLLPDAFAGDTVVLHLAPTDARVLAVHYAEIYEAEL